MSSERSRSDAFGYFCMGRHFRFFTSLGSSVYLVRELFVCFFVGLCVCLSPYSFEYAAKLHDAMTRSTFVQILGLDSIDDFTWNQASLNIKLGGFGLSEVNKSKCLAYVSSWAQSVKDLPNWLFSLLQHIQRSGETIPRPLHLALTFIQLSSPCLQLD